MEKKIPFIKILPFFFSISYRWKKEEANLERLNYFWVGETKDLVREKGKIIEIDHSNIKEQ